MDENERKWIGARPAVVEGMTDTVDEREALESELVEVVVVETKPKNKIS